MTNRYDGPSFFRHSFKVENDVVKQDERQTLSEPEQAIKQAYVPPVLKNNHFKTQLGLAKIIQQLHKSNDDYFIAVADINSAPGAKNATVKANKKAINNKALGHSLTDILAGEQNAQRKLKIFDNQD